MSSYLEREIEAHDRIEVRTGTEVVDGGGDGRLEWLELADRGTDERERVEAAGLFVLIGTETRTDWLPPVVQRDDHGFVLTGTEIDLDAGRGRSSGHRSRSRRACPGCSRPATCGPTA